MHGLAVYLKEGLPFAQCLTSFSSIKHLLCLCYLIYMRFSRSTHLQMFLSLKSLTSIWGWLTYSGGTDRSGVNSVIIFLQSQMTLLRWLISYMDPRLWFSQTCSFGFILFFWCYYLFYNGFPSIGKFWSYCCLRFHWLSIIFTMGCPVSSHCLLFSCWLGWSLWSFERYSMGRYL